jgi:hypothetical protein
MIRKLRILFILVMMTSCAKEGKVTRLESNTNDTVKNNLVSEPSNIEENIPIPDELEMVKFEGDSGILRGVFEEAELGDFAHISVLDTLGRFASFYVLSYHIDSDLWDAMMEGKYKGKKVAVSWKREKIFIKPAQAYSREEVVTQLKFIE